MELLERETCLRELDVALNDAANGTGRVVLVSGEAGIGKTALVEQFTRKHQHSAHVLWGTCDALFTPRPLGPLLDIAAQLGGAVQTQLDSDANRTAVFSAFLGELQGSQPIIAVFEDVHWADEATLDLLKFVGRRIQRTHALLIMTYRDDEIGLRHPLRTVLGDLATSNAVRRVALTPLSVEAVRTLIADRPFDPVELHNQTEGNPFFVTEVLGSGVSGIPSTVRDAVLTRIARLSASGRAVLEASAVIGLRAEMWLLAEVVSAEINALDECAETGIVKIQGEHLVFRHELARQAILEVTSPQRKLVSHRLVLAALKASAITRIDFARLAHHAEAANDHEAVLAYAPAAARQATTASAHRAAAAQYALALQFADDLPIADRASLLEAYAYECNIVDQRDEGVVARRKAVELRRQLDDPLKEGDNLAHMAIMLVLNGKNAEAEQASRAAIDVLQGLPPSRELALAYRTQAGLRMLDRDIAQAIDLGEKAIALADHFGDTELRALSYNTVGTAWLFSDYKRGCAYLERSQAIARDRGETLHVANALGNLGSGSGELFHLHRAERYLAEGITLCNECDFDAARLYMQAWQALTFLYLGRWNEVAESAAIVLQRPGASAISRIMALVALGRLRARRGDPGAKSALDEALELATRTGTLQRLGPVRAARTEAAWLTGDHKLAVEEARAVYDLAVSKQHPWFAGELAFWRCRAGDDVLAPVWVARPFALHLDHDWKGAAEEWARLDCPYEQARALADGDAAAQLQALELFKQLGADPAAQTVREGLRGTPARILDKEKFGGLTEREREVAALIVQGKSNREIAGAMVVSVKTVETYVTRILNKLGFDSRVQVATWAVEKGLTTTSVDS